MEMAREGLGSFAAMGWGTFGQSLRSRTQVVIESPCTFESLCPYSVSDWFY
jgi:hypothetical protein